MFAADAQHQARVGFAAQFGGQFDEFADALDVQRVERIRLQQAFVFVLLQELAGVVAGEAESHLGHVVRAEAEEVGFHRDFVGSDRGARDFDHRSDQVGDGRSLLREYFLNLRHDFRFDVAQLVDVADQRNHDFRYDYAAGFFGRNDGAFDDGARLHPVDFRVSDGQTAATVS